jgi:4-amino-4-deoxychorismate lyase
MCQLFETIKVKDNRLHHMAYHNNRVNASRLALFGSAKPWDLSEIIRIPELDPAVTYRCRFLYAREPEKTEFIPYVRRIIQKLVVVDGHDLEYAFKFADRTAFDTLKAGIPDPERSDILLVKNDRITDTSFSNIILWDGNAWYTPAVPLLRGTKREYYLDQKIIQLRDIRVNDLPDYKTARLINAMLDIDDGEDIPVGNILY